MPAGKWKCGGTTMEEWRTEFHYYLFWKILGKGINDHEELNDQFNDQDGTPEEGCEMMKVAALFSLQKSRYESHYVRL